jgi:hypothetical protein
MGMSYELGIEGLESYLLECSYSEDLNYQLEMMLNNLTGEYE